MKGRQSGPSPLPAEFFARPTLQVARELIGNLLVRELGDGARLVGRIVETEAYREDEPACHAWRRVKPPVTKAGGRWRGGDLLSRPGLAYIYLNYGMYWLLNVITEPEGIGAAVLIRAVEPIEGVDHMRSLRGVHSDTELTNGPGKLTLAFGIDSSFHLLPLTEPPLYLARDDSLAPLGVKESVRIGISKAAELPWRFYAAGNPWVSKHPKLII